MLECDIIFKSVGAYMRHIIFLPQIYMEKINENIISDSLFMIETLVIFSLCLCMCVSDFCKKQAESALCSRALAACAPLSPHKIS